MKVTIKPIRDGINKVYQVRCWQNGRYVRKQFPTRDLAVEHRESLERELDWGADQVIPEQDRGAVLACYRRAIGGGYTLAQACDHFERNLIMRVTHISLEEAVNEFVLAKTAKKLRPRSIKSLKNRLARMVLKMGEGTLVHNISLPLLQKCIDPSWGSRSIVNFRLVASNFFGWCSEKRYCLGNIGEQIEEPMGLDEKPPMFLTVDEVRETLERTRKICPDLLPYVAISIFGGVRNGELQRLMWDDVKLTQGVIDVPAIKAKTRSRRLVTIQPNLKAWMELGGKLPPGNALQRQWKLVKPARYEVDGMRRTFCSYHLAMFESAGKTAMEAGHRESVLYKHYRGLVTKEDAVKFWNIFP